ncbi:MAG: hypothetical protein COA78_38035 [Blastopirellula sp.]|nr:MAG: hypothetical protein COA78_38035 [Blastopirellula sp.]
MFHDAPPATLLRIQKPIKTYCCGDRPAAVIFASMKAEVILNHTLYLCFNAFPISSLYGSEEGTNDFLL